jgi:pyruvate formate lyase activating enzyme
MKESECLGTIFDIKKLAVHDGPGIRTAVFFKGCPLNCIWCHNPEGISSKPELGFHKSKCTGCGACVAVCKRGVHKLGGSAHTIDYGLCINCFDCVDACLWDALIVYGKSVTVEDLMKNVLPDKTFFRESDGGVTVTGGEALMQAEFVALFLQECVEFGLHTCIDTSGAVSWGNFEKVLPYTKMFLYDVKMMDEELHKRYIGASNCIILENLKKLGETKVPIEVRVPVIPNINDDEKQLRSIAEFLCDIPVVESVRLLPYNELTHTKYSLIGKMSSAPQARKQTKEVMLRYGELFAHRPYSVIVGE